MEGARKTVHGPKKGAHGAFWFPSPKAGTEGARGKETFRGVRGETPSPTVILCPAHTGGEGGRTRRSCSVLGASQFGVWAARRGHIVGVRQGRHPEDSEIPKRLLGAPGRGCFLRQPLSGAGTARPDGSPIPNPSSGDLACTREVAPVKHGALDLALGPARDSQDVGIPGRSDAQGHSASHLTHGQFLAIP